MKEICEKELKKLEEVFSDIIIPVRDKSELYKSSKNILAFVKAYFEDSKFFYEKGKYLESFELCSYIWGFLDCLAILGLITPRKTRKYFKIEQD